VQPVQALPAVQVVSFEYAEVVLNPLKTS